MPVSSMKGVPDTLLIGSTQPTHNNQPYLVSLATIIYRRGEARCGDPPNSSKITWLPSRWSTWNGPPNAPGTLIYPILQCKTGKKLLKLSSYIALAFWTPLMTSQNLSVGFFPHAMHVELWGTTHELRLYYGIIFYIYFLYILTLWWKESFLYET